MGMTILEAAYLNLGSVASGNCDRCFGLCNAEEDHQGIDGEASGGGRAPCSISIAKSNRMRNPRSIRANWGKRKKKGTLPELELREAANEGAELIRTGGGEGGAIGIVDLRIHLRGEEANKKVEDVNAETIGNDVEALHEVDADNVDQRHHKAPDPALSHVRRRFVEKVLEALRQSELPPRYGGRRGYSLRIHRWDPLAVSTTNKHDLSHCLVCGSSLVVDHLSVFLFHFIVLPSGSGSGFQSG
ncbi:hypothetical protein SESBI_13877 [Sesbania bispinosa]|nr:hypothetical protein SESBI_13877 [Sesbania bispinosa]